MRTYDIRTLVRGKPGGRVLLPELSERSASVQAYQSVLIGMVNGMAAETRRSVVNALRVDRGLETKSAQENWFEALDMVRARLTAESAQLSDRILKLDAERHTKKFMKDARRTLGVDLSAVIREDDLGEALDSALSRNVGLIKSLGVDTMSRVEQVVHVASVNGVGLREVSKQLTKQFDLTKNRAKLIAQDQISKWNSDLNKLRQTQAGVTKYVWMSSRDEKVRSLHAALNGIEYAWNKPTGAEEGLPPGQPVRCRCVAIGIVDFGGEDGAPGPTPKPEPKPEPLITPNPKLVEVAKKREKQTLNGKPISVSEIDEIVKAEVSASDIYVRVNKKSLNSIIEDRRLKNQFEVASSGGKLNNEGRAIVEENLLGVKPGTSPAKRPIYGYLSDKDGQAYQVDTYGDVALKLKPSVRSRASFTVNDSYDLNGAAHFDNARMQELGDLSNYVQTIPRPLTEPDHMAVPRRTEDLSSYLGKTSKTKAYWEVQVMDGIPLSDIEEALFYSPPSKAIQKRMKDAGLAWRVVE